jgi:DNA-binding SARP family transcriptional activator
MEFLLLGPLIIRSGTDELTVSAPRQRIILATLLLNPNRVVAVDHIADLIWDGAPPPSAAATVRTYVMRLRRVLGEAGTARLTTRAPGYQIRLDEEETDLGRFHAHRRAASALAATGNLHGAVRELQQGLSLWRHAPLLDVPSRALHEVEVFHLQKLRLQTIGWSMDMELALQRHAEILPELWRVVREDPLDEAFVGRLMIALYRSGQKPEALALFQRTRAALIDQFGMEPGAELREIQGRILRGEDELPATSATMLRSERPATGDDQSRVVPAQLPRELPDFTARTGETLDLQNLLTGREPSTQAVTTITLTGRGGVGKTALALRAAHAVRDSFPDGQLYADLHGTHERPADPGEVTARFLAGLGVPQSSIPASDTDRSALYRSLLADRRVLVLLDDARSAAQVRMLIPGSGASRVLITSRGCLADLEGSRTVSLPTFDESASLELLGKIISEQRVDAEPQAARRLLRACSGLPMAIRIAGVRLLGRPRQKLSEFARRLADPRRLLDELQIGDVAVRATLDTAYSLLRHRAPHGIDLRAAFRRLATVHPWCIRPEKAAALLECSEDQAVDVLDDLVDAHLLCARGEACYSLDWLLHAYASERADREERAEHPEEALHGLSQWHPNVEWPGQALRIDLAQRSHHHSLTLLPPLEPAPCCLEGKCDCLITALAWRDATPLGDAGRSLVAALAEP